MINLVGKAKISHDKGYRDKPNYKSGEEGEEGSTDKGYTSFINKFKLELSILSENKEWKWQEL